MKKRTIFIAIMAVLLLIGCTKKEETYKVSEVNGIRITKNTGVPADSTFKIELREVAFIENDNETNPEKSYNQASYMDFDDQGNFFILDRSQSRVFIYDKAGKFVSSFGGKGQGPGEFIIPGTLNVRKDTVYVTDWQGFKIHKFDIEGNFIESKQYSNVVYFPLSPLKFSENYIVSDPTKINFTDEGKKVWISRVSLYDHNFELIKDLHTLEFEPPSEDLEFDPTEKGIAIAASAVNAYVYVYSKAQYIIDVYDIYGNKVREIRKNYSKIKTPADEHKKSEEIWAKRGRKFRSEFRNSIFFLYTDKYNRLWVSCPSREEEKERYYDVFENDIFIKRVKLDVDEGYSPRFVGDKIIGVNRENNNIKIYEY